MCAAFGWRDGFQGNPPRRGGHHRHCREQKEPTKRMIMRGGERSQLHPSPHCPGHIAARRGGRQKPQRTATARTPSATPRSRCCATRCLSPPRSPASIRTAPCSRQLAARSPRPARSRSKACEPGVEPMMECAMRFPVARISEIERTLGTRRTVSCRGRAQRGPGDLGWLRWVVTYQTLEVARPSSNEGNVNGGGPGTSDRFDSNTTIAE
jgi:hypothetical protein